MTNRVKEILYARGFKSVQLTDEMLQRLFPTCPYQYRFLKILHNNAQLTAEEMEAFKDWLGLDTTDELISNQSHD